MTRAVLFWSLWTRQFLFIGTVTTPLLLAWLRISDNWTCVFCILLILRYTRLAGHVVGYYIYRPAPQPPAPRFSRRDVTVILPTIDPRGPDFQECVQSILKNEPAVLLIVTVGADLRDDCVNLARTMLKHGTKTQIAVSALSQFGKRRQVAHAVREVGTSITILANDHVFWNSPDFIPAVLAPFENKNVGVVTPKKRVRRTTPGRWTWASIINFIACNYLQRHNWELRASNAIDGGVFVVSGRTAVYRTKLIKDEELLGRFCDEKISFAIFGVASGLDPDDDNFLTREAMKKQWLIRFQDTEEATIETTLGEWPKFKCQLLRWARTTFRSNPAMLQDTTFLYRYYWSGVMVYWAGLINFAAAWDAALISTLCLSIFNNWQNMVRLLGWIVLSKTIKILPHFRRHPSDLPLLIFQVTFGYIHSIFKFWALITFWDCNWCGRNLTQQSNSHEKNELNNSFIFL